MDNTVESLSVSIFANSLVISWKRDNENSVVIWYCGCWKDEILSIPSSFWLSSYCSIKHLIRKHNMVHRLQNHISLHISIILWNSEPDRHFAFCNVLYSLLTQSTPYSLTAVIIDRNGSLNIMGSEITGHESGTKWLDLTAGYSKIAYTILLRI